METITILKNKLNGFLSLILTFAFSCFAFAQENSAKTAVSTNETKTTTTTEWYAEPTYLIIGAVVLIIIVALLVRGGRKGD
ncbi:MAG: hypothetical protein WCJ72_12280 [Chryseobacterium sp.]|uniref:hypothetical protein n=1 Tax=Chryseobacterium sp. G0201 TaxID=2487065 RepID=UPI000F4E211E|nr:hypothetical protein [Chryseobacterium sp. G0201]AZA52588.1 hypothetical protein EG348_06015 [Chryseobacterium sp. G0201]